MIHLSHNGERKSGAISAGLLHVRIVANLSSLLTRNYLRSFVAKAATLHAQKSLSESIDAVALNRAPMPRHTGTSTVRQKIESGVNGSLSVTTLLARYAVSGAVSYTQTTSRLSVNSLNSDTNFLTAELSVFRVIGLLLTTVLRRVEEIAAKRLSQEVLNFEVA